MYRKPPLFQHVGHYSSLAGKTQKLKEKSFKKNVQNKIVNFTETKNPEPVNWDSNVQVPQLEKSLLNFYRYGLPLIIEEPNTEIFITANYDNPITVKGIF